MFCTSRSTRLVLECLRVLSLPGDSSRLIHRQHLGDVGIRLRLAGVDVGEGLVGRVPHDKRPRCFADILARSQLYRHVRLRAIELLLRTQNEALMSLTVFAQVDWIARNRAKGSGVTL